ncbi:MULTISPECIES: uracil-DNA glycosylase family protein [unclassified Acidovorax]|uniref:uracil-DNA glycosylase family protein n=1 Tax=unclassified Acidovorax TaxID=2684926 RepID=UPI001C45126C|nr:MULTISPECIES: uracil-DNA glycosylase family protein [unclassified Acidovorax]MBV7431431.1 hypothetical protein [Acidovorax sp. sif0732]MBV7452580.1 hypothetical protein [Acidovorax sp. sif0715]
MSLHLDARQRAMLQEMGVTVWGPPQAVAVAAPAAQAVGATAAPGTDRPPARPALVAATTALAAAPDRAAPPTPPRVPARAAPAPAQDTPPSTLSTATAPVAPALRLHAPQPLYPLADPAQAPAGLGPGWLIVAECLTPDDPLGGDAGRLLDNMLRAMQLHRHPRVFLAALERPAPGTQASADIQATLAETVASLQPALVLVLGHVAARVALGRTEPLGRLRAGPHALGGCPAVVTYDPAFLLRSQETKAAAWADLCRALAIVRQASST